MSVKLKPLKDQVLFITGATSGIGIALIRKAAEDGGRVFMFDKNEEVLQKLQDDLRQLNFQTAFTVGDIEEIEQLRTAVDHCLSTFGTIDTWINYATMAGIENGSMIAMDNMKDSGGCLINVDGLAASIDVKEFTDSLRKEFKMRKMPIFVSLIKSRSIESVSSDEEVAELILEATSRKMKEVSEDRENNRSLARSWIWKGLSAAVLGVIFLKRRKLI